MIQKKKSHLLHPLSHLDKKSGPLAPDQIPLLLRVEIAQVEIPIGQLMELEAGNMIELNKRPTNNVNLTINGNIVGKGELIQIGDILGVRSWNYGVKNKNMVEPDHHKQKIQAAATAALQPAPLPAKIGPYQVEALLEKGGMSYLYLSTPLKLKILFQLKSFFPNIYPILKWYSAF